MTLAAHEYLLPTLDPPSGPATGLRQRVAAGQLGEKTGEGFRSWREGEAERVRQRVLAHLAGFPTEPR